ncbi:hypothetical protein TNCV_1002541 [Trichonephila clavipes]|nr:hypothetical protein TNCV_1002541 [Trichonephila clavipes]
MKITFKLVSHLSSITNVAGRLFETEFFPACGDYSKFTCGHSSRVCSGSFFTLSKVTNSPWFASYSDIKQLTVIEEYSRHEEIAGFRVVMSRLVMQKK